MHPMRRKDKERDAAFAWQVLRDATYATLAMTDSDGAPYCVPVNHVADEQGNAVYFHCAGAGAMKIHRIALLVGHMVHGHTIGGAVTVGHGQGGIGGVTQHLPGKGGVTFLVFSAHRMHGLSSLSLFRPAGRSIRFHHIMGRLSSFSNRGSIPSSTWPAFWHIS